MKKPILLLAAAISTICLSSCSKTIDENQSSESKQFKEVEMSFSAIISESESKTELQSDGKHIFWSPGDSINVFQGSIGFGKFTAINKTVCETTTFTGLMNVATGSIEKDPEECYFWAVYPYNEDCTLSDGAVSINLPDVQTAVEGGFENGIFPAIAKSKSMNLAFRNVCGGIEFSVSQSGIDQVIFTGNNGENLAGKALVSMDDSGLPFVKKVTDGKRNITVNAPKGETFKTGVKYYVVSFPTELSHGFSMSFAKADCEGILKSTTAVAVKRSVFATLDKPDSKAKYYKFVDLGLSIKWAECNVGASNSREFGDYFAFGETASKEQYNINNYKHYLRDTIIGKYNTLEKYGTVDNKKTLEAVDDAATVNLGSEWRTPTLDEWKELHAYCTLTTDVVDGIEGIRATSNISGFTDKSIFIPQKKSISDTSSTRIYMTSTLHESRPMCFRSVRLFIDTYWTDWRVLRSFSSYIRPVTQSKNAANSVDLGLSVRWSTMNIGASKPSEIGNLYKWGCTNTGETEKHINISTNILKYSLSDGIQVLKPEDDAATVNLSKNWKTPTVNQYKELIDNCTWEWIEDANGKGLKATSKKPGFTDKSIFFIGAGMIDDDARQSVNKCNYWTSNVHITDFSEASYFYGSSSTPSTGTNGTREKGRTIRPVYVK